MLNILDVHQKELTKQWVGEGVYFCLDKKILLGTSN